MSEELDKNIDDPYNLINDNRLMFLGPSVAGITDVIGQIFDLVEANNSTFNGYGAKKSEINLSVASSASYYIFQAIAEGLDTLAWYRGEIQKDRDKFDKLYIGQGAKDAIDKYFDIAKRKDLGCLVSNFLTSASMGVGELMIEFAGRRKSKYEKSDIQEIIGSYPSHFIEALDSLKSKGSNSHKEPWNEFDISEKKIILSDFLQRTYLKLNEKIQNIEEDEIEELITLKEEIRSSVDDDINTFFSEDEKSHPLREWDNDEFDENKKKRLYEAFDEQLASDLSLLGPYNAESDKEDLLSAGVISMSIGIGIRFLTQIFQGYNRRRHEIVREALTARADEMITEDKYKDKS